MIFVLAGDTANVYRHSIGHESFRSAVLFIYSVSDDDSPILSLGSLQIWIFRISVHSHNGQLHTHCKLVICSHRHYCKATLKRHVSAAMHVQASNRASEMHTKRVWFRSNQYSVDTFTCSTCSCISQIHLSHTNIHWWRSHEPPHSWNVQRARSAGRIYLCSVWSLNNCRHTTMRIDNK